MRNLKKKYYLLAGLTIIILFSLFFASSIIKNYLVNNSQELVGRKINLNELHINYLKVQIIARDFTMYENNKKDTFIYFKELLINYDPWKLVNNEYAVSQIRLVKPFVSIQQNGENFNFDDLISPTDSSHYQSDTIPHQESNNVKFSVRNIDLQDGIFKYYDKQIDNLLNLDNLNLELPLIAWDSRNSEMGVQFSIGEKGVVSIDANINQQSKIYNINFGTKNIQLSSFTNYLKDYMYISELKGLLQSELNIKGSIEQIDSIIISGKIEIDSLSIKNNQENVMATAAKVSTKIKLLDIKNESYQINDVKLNKPLINVALHSEQSNWEYFLTPILSDTINSAIEKTNIDTQTITESKLYYKIDSLILENGEIHFTDNTLNRPFNYIIKDIDIELSDLFEKNDSILLKWSTTFNNEGKYTGVSTFSINNPLYFYYKGEITNLDLHSLSPYTEYYISHPIISGLLNYEASINMSPELLKNDNYLLIKEMEFGKKTKDSTSTKLPVKLALYLLKDTHDNIEFELPVTGNPSEPGFKLGPIIWNTFGKFLVKTATQPFNSLAKLVGTQPEELERIHFVYTQDSLTFKEKKTLDKIAEILTKKKDLIFSFRQETVFEEELKYLAEKQIKDAYIQDMNIVNLKDWRDIKNTDERFNLYLNKKYPSYINSDIYTFYLNIVSKEKLQTDFEQLYNHRNEIITNYMITQKGCNEESIRILHIDFENMPKELNTPGFRVEVSVK